MTGCNLYAFGVKNLDVLNWGTLAGTTCNDPAGHSNTFTDYGISNKHTVCSGDFVWVNWKSARTEDSGSTKNSFAHIRIDKPLPSGTVSDDMVLQSNRYATYTKHKIGADCTYPDVNTEIVAETIVPPISGQ